MAHSQLVLAFAQALTELVTVEKKNIMALTEIARDALRTEPRAAPSLADLITSRIVQAPAPQKLPVLYLLDSISKLVGEPYKTLFAHALPEAFINAWQYGGPGLQRPLDKLLGTWSGVYPAHVLTDIQARLAALRAPPQPHLQEQPMPGANGLGAAPYWHGPPGPAPPMATDPRLVPPQPMHGGYAQAGPYQQPPGPAPYAGYPLAPQQQAGHYQQPPQEYYQQPQAVQQQAAPPQVSVPDLLSSLMDAGLLAGPGAQPAAALPLASGASSLLDTPPYAAAALATPPHAAAATTTLEREQPATTRFLSDRLKEHNPSAVARLLRQTEVTKSRFLDRKFLRRQQKAAGAAARASRLWYVDLDTWMASTTGAVPGAAVAGGGGGSGTAGPAAQQAAAPPQKHSVPVDDSQAHCALSGEQFEQFWDEEHQEWRYRDAKALDAEEAASYGLEEGAIVLVSALGKPATSVLQPGKEAGGGGGGGIVAQLQVQQEIAADLAAAAAAVAPQADGDEGGEAKDEKPSLKHPLEDSALAGGADQPQDKRAKVA